MNTYDEPLIVVFGGGGYIGCWVTKELLALGYSVRVFDSFLFGREGLDTLSHPNLEVVEGNICDVQSVSRAVSGAQTVILLSAIVGRRFEETANTPYREVNFLASSVVLDASIEHGVERFVFASTDSVYGALNGLVYETAIPEPITLYSRLKLRMEERVIKAKKRTFHPTALRICTCYGYSPRMRFDLVPNTMIRDAVCKNVITISNEDSCRAFVHVRDAARAIVKAVKAHINLISGEIFNIGSNDQTLTFKEIANIIKTMCPNVEVEIGNDPADLVDYQLSCKKIEKLLDFVPQWNMERSLDELKSLLSEGRFGDPYEQRYSNR